MPYQLIRLSHPDPAARAPHRVADRRGVKAELVRDLLLRLARRQHLGDAPFGRRQVDGGDTSAADGAASVLRRGLGLTLVAQRAAAHEAEKRVAVLGAGAPGEAHAAPSDAGIGLGQWMADRQGRRIADTGGRCAFILRFHLPK